MMATISASTLLAMASGEHEPGPHRCFYCGGECGESIPSRAHVKATFTNHALVKNPTGAFVCRGCVLAMTNGVKLDGFEKPQKAWQFTYLVTRNSVQRLRGDLTAVVDACLRPPEPPFAIVVAVSLKKHLLFRAPVNLDRDYVRVQFEEGQVDFHPHEFAARFDMCERIAAACGKMAVTEGNPQSVAFGLANYYEEWESLFENWEKVRHEPLTALCAHLCPKKEVCGVKYPGTRCRRVAAKTCRAGGPGLFD